MKTFLAALAAPLLLLSCSILKPIKDTSVHHLLNPAVPERTITGSSPAVAVATPALPDYLNRQQLVSRSGHGELVMNPSHLWAEPLEAGIARVTAANLGRLTNSLNIQPVDRFISMDYQALLELRIDRFEPDAQNLLVLKCTWKLQPVKGGVAPTRAFETVVPIGTAAVPLRPTGSQTERIRAMDEALAQLARQIAKSL
jgi:uncharacterized protein